MPDQGTIGWRSAVAGCVALSLAWATGCGRSTVPAASPAPEASLPAGSARDADVAQAPEAEERDAVADSTPDGEPPPGEETAGPGLVVADDPEVPVGPCVGGDPTQCTVVLEPPADGRMVRLASEGVTMTFGFGEFITRARNLRDEATIAFLESRPADENPVPLGAAASTVAGNRVAFVVADLLDDGKARVHDGVGDRDVDRIVRETWTWMGCGGRCRQSGRQYRLQVPGDVFYRVTDLFADSF